MSPAFWRTLFQHRNSDKLSVRPFTGEYIADVALGIAADAVVLISREEVVGYGVQTDAAGADGFQP